MELASSVRDLGRQHLRELEDRIRRRGFEQFGYSPTRGTRPHRRTKTRFAKLRRSRTESGRKSVPSTSDFAQSARQRTFVPSGTCGLRRMFAAIREHFLQAACLRRHPWPMTVAPKFLSVHYKALTGYS